MTSGLRILRRMPSNASEPFPAPTPDHRPSLGFSTPVFPALANHYGTLFGGEALNLMGRAALLAAAGRPIAIPTDRRIPSREVA